MMPEQTFLPASVVYYADLHPPNLPPISVHFMPTRTFARVLLSLAATLSPGVLHAEPPVNLALHAEYVSSDPNVYGWEQPGLTDGVWGADATTCYATGKSPAFPKTVTVDLRAAQPVSNIVFGVPPLGSTRTVDVSLSADGTRFTGVGTHTFDQNGAQRAVVTIPRTEARYVRLTFQDHYPDTPKMPGNYAFVSELEVYDGPAPTPPDPALMASTPTVKDPDRHQGFLARIAEAPVGLLFLGDSILDRWPRFGETSWLQFAPEQPANFGVGGDQTGHLLWRIENGELDGIHPKAVVILIGTNNVERDQPEWTAAAIKTIVETVRGKLPSSKILLLALLPRDGRDSPSRQRNTAVNGLIAPFADGEAVRFLDLGPLLVDDHGEIAADLMPDRLHPTAKGYERMSRAMQPLLAEMLR